MSESDRRSRFSRLERARDDAGTAPAPRADTARIGAVQAPGEPRAAEEAPPEVADGALDRFRPPPVRPVELADRSADAQPFRRCMGCEADSNATALTCWNCGADLLTEAQRAFNERLWAERRAEAEALEAGSRERAHELEAARAEAARGERERLAMIAREVGKAEGERLAREGLGGPLDWTPGPATGDPLDLPPGRRWLATLPPPVPALVAIGVAGLVLALLLAFLPAGILAAIAAGVLFFQPKRPRR